MVCRWEGVGGEEEKKSTVSDRTLVGIPLGQRKWAYTVNRLLWSAGMGKEELKTSWEKQRKKGRKEGKKVSS